MTKLIVTTGALQGAEIELVGEHIAVGKASDNDIALPEESVSEHHAVLLKQGEHYAIQDAGSATGVFVNGGEIVLRLLQTNDTVVVGDVEMKFVTTALSLHLPSGVKHHSAKPLIPVRDSGDASPQAARSSGSRVAWILVGLLVAVGSGFYFTHRETEQKVVAEVALPANPEPTTNAVADTTQPRSELTNTAASAIAPVQVDTLTNQTPQSPALTQEETSTIVSAPAGNTNVSVTPSVPGADSVMIAGTKRGSFMQSLGCKYEVCGSWVGMNKLVNGEASVAIIDLSWSDYLNVVRDVPSDLRQARVMLKELNGLQTLDVGLMPLIFAHTLPELVTNNFSAAEIKKLYDQGNWSAVGGPNAPCSFTQFRAVSSDQYSNVASQEVNPFQILLKKEGISRPKSVSMDIDYMLQQPSTFKERDYALIAEKEAVQHLPEGWFSTKQPVFFQPLIAVFRQKDSERVLPVINALIKAALDRGDLLPITTQSASTAVAGGLGTNVLGRQPASQPLSDSGLFLPPEWNQSLNKGSVVLQELQSILSAEGTPAVDLAPHPEIHIYRDIAYLEPLESAGAKFGKTVFATPVLLGTPGFPEASFYYYALDGNFDEGFNRLFLVTDKKKQVVAIQFADESPRSSWLGNHLEGNKVYDFVRLKLKGITSWRVAHYIGRRDGEMYPSRGFSASSHSVYIKDHPVLRIDSDLVGSGYSQYGRQKSKERTRLFLPQPIINLILFRLSGQVYESPRAAVR